MRSVLALLALVGGLVTTLAQGVKTSVVDDLGGKFDKSFNEGVH